MITIKYSELQYDIDNRTWSLAKVRISDPELQNDAQTDDTEYSVSKVRRYIDSAMAIVETMLSDFIVAPIATSKNDELSTDTEWDIELKVGKLKVSEEAMAKLLHSYVVALSLSQWAEEFSPNEVAAFVSGAQAIKDTIIQDLYDIVAPVKVPRNTTTDNQYSNELHVE